jgi:hypothetical protein
MTIIPEAPPDAPLFGCADTTGAARASASTTLSAINTTRFIYSLLSPATLPLGRVLYLHNQVKKQALSGR